MYGIRHSQEFLFAQEVQFRTQIHPRIQIMGAVPYQFSIQKRDFGSDAVWGIGDPNLMGNFILFQNKDSLGMSKNFLSVGVGMKAPLGKNVPNTNVLKNLYPGTGSWDYLFITNYTKQFSKKWGWQSELSYSLKGKDKYGFQYGNSTMFSSQVFTSRGVSSYRLLIALGASYENLESSRANGQVNSLMSNAGYVLSSKLSVNLLTYKWLWSVYVQQPLAQNINSGTIRQNLSGGLSLNYLIKKSKK